MKHKLEEVNEVIHDLQKELPEQMGTFQKFLTATEKPSVLDAKTKELIKLLS